MKKIMIYSGRPSWKGVGASVLPNAASWLFFIIFLCGITLGLFMFRADDGGFFVRLARACLSADTKSCWIWTCVGAAAALLLSVISGFSCFGLALLGALPFGCGMAYALLASQILSADPVRGLGRYTLEVLPGAILTATSTICLCAVSAEASKTVAATVFRGDTQTVDIKKYALKSLAFCAGILLSIPVNYIAAALFSGLFQ